jgi:hypothetical protein
VTLYKVVAVAFADEPRPSALGELTNLINDCERENLNNAFMLDARPLGFGAPHRFIPLRQRLAIKYGCLRPGWTPLWVDFKESDP